MTRRSLFAVVTLLVTTLGVSFAYAKRPLQHCPQRPTTPVYVDLGAGKYECRHPSRYYVEQCPNGYTYNNRTNKCQKTEWTNWTTPKCSVPNYKCTVSGRDKCYGKRNCKGKFKGSISCASGKTLKIDNSGSTDRCAKSTIKTKSLSVTKCPLRWSKCSLKSSGANGYKQYYCCAR